MQGRELYIKFAPMEKFIAFRSVCSKGGRRRERGGGHSKIHKKKNGMGKVLLVSSNTCVAMFWLGEFGLLLLKRYLTETVALLDIKV